MAEVILELPISRESFEKNRIFRESKVKINQFFFFQPFVWVINLFFCPVQEKYK